MLVSSLRPFALARRGLENRVQVVRWEVRPASLHNLLQNTVEEQEGQGRGAGAWQRQWLHWPVAREGSRLIARASSLLITSPGSRVSLATRYLPRPSSSLTSTLILSEGRDGWGNPGAVSLLLPEYVLECPLPP